MTIDLHEIIKKSIKEALNEWYNEKNYKTNFDQSDINTKLKQENTKNEWIALTKWGEHFKYPSQGTMRNIVARRKENGAEIFLSLINSRFYIDLKKFNKWMEDKKLA